MVKSRYLPKGQDVVGRINALASELSEIQASGASYSQLVSVLHEFSEIASGVDDPTKAMADLITQASEVVTDFTKDMADLITQASEVVTDFTKAVEDLTKQIAEVM